MTLRSLLLGSAAAALLAVGTARAAAPEDAAPTATPIKHVVVIFNENVSYDHYFATYPRAANPPGEPRFTACQARRATTIWSARTC